MAMQNRSLREFSNVLALLGIGVVFAVLDAKFFWARNLSLLMTEVSITAILALGMLVILLPGHVDLSVGSGVGLLGGVAAVLVIQQGWPAPVAMGVAVLGGVGLWLAMGTLIVKEKMPAFIVTLGGLLLFKGLFWLVIQNSTIPVVAGGAVNGYSLLTTYYLPAMAGWGLAIVVMGVVLTTGTRVWNRESRNGPTHKRACASQLAQHRMHNLRQPLTTNTNQHRNLNQQHRSLD